MLLFIKSVFVRTYVAVFAVWNIWRMPLEGGDKLYSGIFFLEDNARRGRMLVVTQSAHMIWFIDHLAHSSDMLNKEANDEEANKAENAKE